MPSTATEEVLEETPQTEEEQDEEQEEQEEVAKAVAKPVQPRRRGPNKPKEPVAPAPSESQSRKREPGEDFLDYLNQLPQEAFSASGACVYIYRSAPTGNVQLDKIFKPITLDELKNLYAAKHGPGNYLVQFNTRDKNLSSGSQRYTFDGTSLAMLGDGAGGVLSGGVLTTSAQATSEAIKIIAEASREANKANTELIKDHVKENNKGSADIGVMFTAMSTMFVSMFQHQNAEAQRRAEAAEKRAEEQRKADQIEADRKERERKDELDRREREAKAEADRREKEAERRFQEAKEEAQRQRERDKEFNAILLKQADTKADSLTQMTNLLTSFMTVREKIEDSFGGNQPKGWEGVIGNAIDKAGEILPAIMTRFGGTAGAPQQPQMIPGPQGPIGPQAPEQQEFPEMVHRIGKYLGRDVTLWDGSYLVRLIETEYPVTHAQLVNQPKDVILEAFKSLPIGKAILEHEAAAKLISDVLDVIKNPDLFDTVFPEELEEPEPQEPPPGPQRRKANGRIHREKVGEPV